MPGIEGLKKISNFEQPISVWYEAGLVVFTIQLKHQNFCYEECAENNISIACWILRYYLYVILGKPE